MSKLIKSPIWDNWFEKNNVNKSLIICSPYFKKDALDKIIDKYELSDEECVLDVKILIRGKLEDFLSGSSDLTALEALLELKCIKIDNIRRVTNLHMKAYLCDGEDLLIGSGNCTGPGLSFNKKLGNVEVGIQTNDRSIITDFSEYFSEIFDKSESLNDFYDQIVKKYNDETKAPFLEKPRVNNERLNELKARFDFREKNKGNEKKIESLLEITAADIPQFSNFDIVLNETLEEINKANEEGKELTFSMLGDLLPGQKEKNDVAKKKYGENHAKTAEILGLATIVPERTRRLKITSLGKEFLKSTEEEKRTILTRQITKCPIVKDIFALYELNGPFDITEYLQNYLSEKTAIRRRPNVKKFFEKLVELDVEGAEKIIANIFN